MLSNCQKPQEGWRGEESRRRRRSGRRASAGRAECRAQRPPAGLHQSSQQLRRSRRTRQLWGPPAPTPAVACFPPTAPTQPPPPGSASSLRSRTSVCLSSPREIIPLGAAAPAGDPRGEAVVKDPSIRDDKALPQRPAGQHESLQVQSAHQNVDSFAHRPQDIFSCNQQRGVI